jgi:hypothetical protein
MTALWLSLLLLSLLDNSTPKGDLSGSVVGGQLKSLLWNHCQPSVGGRSEAGASDTQ